ncbi:MAG: apolipoprotein N-acyltransferase [Pseudonocardiaceae bacterium]
MAAPTVIRSAEPEWPGPGRHGLGALARCLLGGTAGVVLFASFSPRELWWLAPVAFALLGPVLHGRRARAGFGYGLLFGLGFYLPLLSWTGEFVGSLPWLALATLESLVAALAGAGIALVSRLRAAPLWATGVWVAAEALIARVPFDGFPWGRVAFSQPEGLFLPIAALGGTPLLGAAVVLTGLSVGELSRRAVGELGRRAVTGTYRHRQLTVPALLAVVPVLAGFAAAPLVGTAARAGEVTVALVQGNVPRAGLDFNAQRRAVLDNHVARTEELAVDVVTRRAPRPQLVIWPENSSDIDPLRNADAAQAIDRAARTIGVPILVGAVLRSGGDQATNTMIVWDPATGPGEHHDKRRVQPFGEYVPYHDFFRRFSPLVDRASNFVPGAGDGVVDLGGVPVGIATCYEVVFDDLVRQSVQSGAQFIAVPTNNATFGYTNMTYQQQAMSRVRAVEHGRAVVIAATSGSSAVIAPDGTVEQHTNLFVPAVLVAVVPLRTATTPATRLGAGPEWVLVALGVTAVFAGVFAGAVTRGRDGARTARADSGVRRWDGP